MSLYQDQIKKISYYRARIVKDLVRKGFFPNDKTIDEALNSINTMLGIFQYIQVSNGDQIDTKKINEDIVRIYQDLKILYELAYQITVKEYEELKVYCESKLVELQNMAEEYQYKTKFEMDSTYIGDTVFYQSNGYDITNDNGCITIKLGKISVEQQSKLTCVIDCDSLDQENIIFSFVDDDGKAYNCSPYDYNKDFFIVPGTLKCNTYTVDTKNERISSSFICTPYDLQGQISHDHKYKLYGGKGYVCLGYYSKQYAEKLTNVPITIANGGICTFYILNGTYANFNFTTMPDNKNFEGVQITELNEHHKIIIEHRSTLSFDFITDGTIYATHQNGIVKNNELYYPISDQISDVLVKDYSVGDKIDLDVTITAGPYLRQGIPIINSIAIKQLSSLEEVNS